MAKAQPKLAREARRLATAFTKAADSHRGDEAGFRSEAEAALEHAATALGIDSPKHLEVTLAHGRADAVFNRLVVEWERPGALGARSKAPGNRHALKQVRGYLDGLAEKERREVARLIGVACDGRFMIFARYRAGHWIPDDPARVDERSCAYLLDALRATQGGRALIGTNLLEDFSAKGHRGTNLIKALHDQLEAELGQRPYSLPARLFAQWERLFAVATGTTGDAAAIKADARKALAEMLGEKPSSIQPARVLFAVQTYFAIVTKLIATLSLSLFVTEAEWNLEELATGGDADLHKDMVWLNSGGPFRKIGLPNAIEPDVFGWFLENWPPAVKNGVRAVADRLKEYDPTTLEVSPEDARDLLKDLYQGLLPRPVRHALGQYFTPDWLAARLLGQIEYTGQRGVRVLDPSCGTGTFLVLAINQLREQLREEAVTDHQALRAIVDSIVGIDIDPLAVVAARANYILALGPLVGAAGRRGVDVPVYLADSIVSPRIKELSAGDHLVLETSAGRFELPVCVDTAKELRDVCDLASRGLDEGWNATDFAERAGRACSAKVDERKILAGFFDACRTLHTEEIDGIWTHVIRNAFMPAFLNRFDYVIGNPPWVNWESLPATYRERTDSLWREAGLFVHSGMATMLGAGKKDVAMLMSYVISERLLAKDGSLGFVITETVFKTAGAGQGFRRFRFGEGGPDFKVVQVADMVDLKPFTGAANRTALLVWTRDKKTRYPVRYTVWQRKQRLGIDSHATLEEVDEATRPLPLVASPVRSDDLTSAWLTAPREIVAGLRKMAETGEPRYRAHEGVNSGGANGVYWLAVEGVADERGSVPISNLNQIGKSDLPKIYGRVEAELLHPLVRGEDVRRWSAVPSAEILFVQDPEKRRGINEARMRAEFPNAFSYIEQFEGHLRSRAAFKRYFTRRDPKRGTVETGPYWSMFDVGGYTLAKHKVVWKDQAADFAAAVLTGGTPLPLPNHKVMLGACSTQDEAHYVCGALNSIPARAFICAYTVETQISTHVLKTIHVPRFDRDDSVHRALAEASRAAHAAVKNGGQPDQASVDAAAARLWGLGEEDVAAMGAFLDQLLKRDLSGG